jgi:hypothetical protein
MAQFMCPGCGSEFFKTAKVGSKTIFQVETGREIQILQAASADSERAEVDESAIFCCACSWHGSLAELVESDRD